MGLGLEEAVDLTQILAASIGFGFGGESFRRWRAYKKLRATMTREERNAGFWTDAKVRASEIAVWSVLGGLPLSGFILLRGMS